MMNKEKYLEFISLIKDLPTLENIAMWIGKQLKKEYSNVRSVKLSRPSCGESCVYKIT